MHRVVSTDTISIIVSKGRERYVFSFDEASRYRLIRKIWWMALDRRLSFDWEDYCAVYEKVREVLA